MRLDHHARHHLDPLQIHLYSLKSHACNLHLRRREVSHGVRAGEHHPGEYGTGVTGTGQCSGEDLIGVGDGCR